MLALLIDGWKNRGLTPDQVPVGEAASFAGAKGKKLYIAYQDRLKVLNAADFGDLLLENIRLFRQHPGRTAAVSGALQIHPGGRISGHQCRAVSMASIARASPSSSTAVAAPAQVGEAEGFDLGDTFAPEPKKQKNICCVGDDDQSIYGWRGAEVDNILRFDHDFPGAKVIRLERNYRSTGHILAAASHLISHNQDRLGKTLRTEDVPGEKVTVTGAWDSEEEARAVGEEIEQLHRQSTSSTRSPSWCALPSRCVNSKTALSRLACPIA